MSRTNNQKLSAIFTVDRHKELIGDTDTLFSQSEVVYQPCLILFDPENSKLSTNDDQITAKYELKSQSCIPKPHGFMYLEDRNSIIYETSGDLFCLD